LRAGSSFRNRKEANKKIMKKKVLFICAQNSARSQIAAALLNNTCGDYFKPIALDWSGVYSIL
jgi:hypothetical protein